MRFLNRLFCLICVAFACGSCVESVTLSYEEMEAIALEEWIKIHRPELINNYQPNGGYYVEILDEGVADSVPVRYHNAWLWFDVTCRDLAGNVVLTRNSELARMQDSYTDYTHYVPYFLFCGEENWAISPSAKSIAVRVNLYDWLDGVNVVVSYAFSGDIIKRVSSPEEIGAVFRNGISSRV